MPQNLFMDSKLKLKDERLTLYGYPKFSANVSKLVSGFKTKT
jgi:hypothetical protein